MTRKRKEVHYEDDRPVWDHALHLLAAGGVPGKDDLQDFFVYLHWCYRTFMKEKGANPNSVLRLSIRRDDVRSQIYKTLESTRYANIVVSCMGPEDDADLNFIIEMTDWR